MLKVNNLITIYTPFLGILIKNNLSSKAEKDLFRCSGTSWKLRLSCSKQFFYSLLWILVILRHLIGFFFFCYRFESIIKSCLSGYSDAAKFTVVNYCCGNIYSYSLFHLILLWSHAINWHLILPFESITKSGICR